MVCLFQFPFSVFGLFFLFIFDDVRWNFSWVAFFDEGFQVVGLWIVYFKCSDVLVFKLKAVAYVFDFFV